ncbi:MAG: AAA family ATPase [Myxococcota bacterium]|nr:AAA family ATPase [Myxococcota bacterium]
MNARRFTPLAVLGRGGGGTVERVHDARRGAEVALKRLRGADRALEAALRREHRLLTGLRHPSLVIPLELGRDEEGLYLVSPLAEGDDFVTHCRGSWLRIASAVPQLLSALRYLHERGLTHGDLSPANVRVAPSGRLRLIDFGLAGLEGERLAPRGGTPGYAAPERLAGGGPSAASDLHAFGALLDAVAPRPRPVAVEACLAALRGAPSTRPSAASLEESLLPALGAASPAPPLERGGGLVGRAALIGQVTGALLGERSVLLTGPSGVGKTALLDAIAERLSGARLVMRARARPGSRAPFEALDQLFEGATSALGPPSPELREVAARLGRHSVALAGWIDQSPHALRTKAELRAKLFGGRVEPDVARDVAALLAALPAPLLILDDLHWFDPDSRTCLRTLVERGEALVLAAARSAVAADFPCARVDVAPLDDEAMRRLLAATGVDGTHARRVAEGAHGLPGLALLAARFARGERPLERALSERVRELADRERRALAALWVAGGPLESGELGDDVCATLDAAGLISRSGSRVDLVHDALRAPLAVALGEDWLRTARLERATEPEVPAAARVEAFLALGDERRAAELARVAIVEATEAGAPRRAAELWEIVARVDPSARLEHARALALAGEHDAAAERFRALADETEGVERRAHTLARAHALLAARRVAEGKAALGAALGAPAPPRRTLLRFLRGPRPEPARLDLDGAELALRDAALAAYFDLLEGVRLALDARSGFVGRDPALGAWADSLLAFFARFAGATWLSERYRRAAARWGADHARPIVAQFPTFLDAYDELRSGSAARAVELLDHALAELEGTPDARSFEAQLVLSLRTSAVIKTQRLPALQAAVARFEANTRLQADVALHVHVETARAVARVWEGRFEDAVRGLERAEAAWPARPRLLQHLLLEAYAAWPRALLGDAPAAHEALAAALRGHRAMLLSAYGPILLAFSAATELAAHRAGHASASPRRALSHALLSAGRPSFASGLARRVIAHVTGRGWARVERAARRDDQPIDLALAIHARGVATRDARLRGRAREILADAGASPRLLEERERLA